MTLKRVGVLVLAMVAGALTLGWYIAVEHRQPAQCGFCSRPLQKNLSVTAEIGGKRRHICCARCAITEANQEQKPVRFIEVHDYASGAALAPDDAHFVEGSRAATCDHAAMKMDEMKHTSDLAFDRCSPGTVAFAKKQDADAFIAQNGGTAISIGQLTGEVRIK